MPRIARDRRGATALTFALLATCLLGVAAMATEAATWYLARQQAYGVADAAAMAGALAVGSGLSSASAAVAATAQENGFGSGNPSSVIPGASSVTVTANNPPSTGAYAGDATAVEVLVNIDIPTGIAALFDLAKINLASRSVARLQPTWPACVVSLTGALTVDISVNAYEDINCYFASNATGAGAVNVDPEPTLWVFSVSTKGDCTGCPQVDPLWGGYDPSLQSFMYRPNSSYQPATTDPFAPKAAALASDYPQTFACPKYVANGFFYYTDYVNANPPTPPLDAANCPLSPARVTLTGTVPPNQPDPNFPGISSACAPLSAGNCAYLNMDLTIDSPVTLQAGTYLLMNASLALTANAVVSCFATNYSGQNFCGKPSPPDPTGTAGVTIVLANPTDAQPRDAGQVRVDPAASVRLDEASSAAFPVDAYPASPLNGVLIYRDPTHLAPDSSVAPAVVIEDDLSSLNAQNGQPSILNGAIYAPGATVWFGANAWGAAGGPPTHCNILLAGTVNLGYWPPMAGQGTNANWISVAGDCAGRGIELTQTGHQNLPYVQIAKVVE